ncbi:hypothetical protein [Mesorhizobium sp. M0060]|uniref:hypothetical protein n=1 Tax=Mesorhizobium sp. M0060 TaxID=2956866 RepID=UPI0033367133
MTSPQQSRQLRDRARFKMVDALTRDYANTAAMIFGTPPSFDDILESARQIEQDINTHS